MKVKVDLVDNKIAAYSEYDADFVRKFKAVGGGRWHPADKSWRYTLSMDVCRAMRREFGDNLLIGISLSDWARKAIALEEKMIALSKANDAQLEVIHELSPELAKAMEARRYQRVGAQFIATGRRVLIADEPGLGKTLEAIGGLMEAKCWRGPILVIAPLTSLRSVWERELSRWTNDATVTVAVPPRFDSAGARITLIDKWLTKCEENVKFPHILVVNPEMVREAERKFPVLNAITWNAIIVDESHRYLAGIKSAKKKTMTGAAMLKLKVRQGGVKIALSGTPMRGKPTNLWGTLHWLEPKRYSSFYNWAEMYFEVGSSKYSRFIIGKLRDDREEAMYRSLDRIMLRRTKSEVVKELPPKQYTDVYCDMTITQAKQYKQMAEQAMADLGDFNLKAIGILAIMTRLKQMANCAWMNLQGNTGPLMTPENSCKTAMIEQMLIERGIAGDERYGANKIVIASQFTQVINSLYVYLDSINVPCDMITGEVREFERTEVTAKFQSEGGPRVLLMNTKAGGVSITLDAFCDELIIIDETWNPDDQIQLEDRIHRVSRIHQVMIYNLIGTGTIDEYIKKIADEKRSVTGLLLDGRRGVDFAKILATAV